VDVYPVCRVAIEQIDILAGDGLDWRAKAVGLDDRSIVFIGDKRICGGIRPCRDNDLDEIRGLAAVVVDL
jgi:hypothetical protein